VDSQQALKILIADDHPLVLDSLTRVLARDDGFETVGLLSGGAHVVELVAETAPDMVLMDVHMPDLDGLSVLDQLRTSHPSVEVVMISAGADAGEIRSALRRGASGYLVKSINPGDIPAALRQIHERTAYMYVLDSPSAAGESMPGHDGPGSAGEEVLERAGLTPREREILIAMVRGLSNGEIGREQWVTEQTVKFHVGNIYRKLETSNRVAAIRIGIAAGLDAVAESAAVLS
jgi:DNA-binding NarL/FixJ family response regulator